MTEHESHAGRHTPTPWPEVEYDNDTGPNDEGYWQWWEIEGVGRFDNEADAEFARHAANCHDALLAALVDCVDRFATAFPAAENYEPIKCARAAIALATSEPKDAGR